MDLRRLDDCHHRLEVGTQYSVQMRSVNEAGAGPWSAWKAGKTALSADAAELSSLVLTGAMLYPSFAAPDYFIQGINRILGHSDHHHDHTEERRLHGRAPRREQPTLTDADGADGFQVVLSVGETSSGSG